jgi:hypothetical protein
VRIFKNKPFARFARKADLDDAALCKAIAGAERGLIDADLGGGVINVSRGRAAENQEASVR